jgi:hypothetical protein
MKWPGSDLGPRLLADRLPSMDGCASRGADARALVRVAVIPPAEVLALRRRRWDATLHREGASTVKKPLLAVLVNEPHSVGVATMVSVKGWVGLAKRPLDT